MAIALLLVRAGTPVTPELTWLTTVLGQKLAQIRGRGSVAEKARKLHHERALFDTIINSVTDPILLTDTEGKLIIANARAEKLFASREDESEGRRRAVALNNMLFTAALAFVADLHREFNPRRMELPAARGVRQQQINDGAQLGVTQNCDE